MSNSVLDERIIDKLNSDSRDDRISAAFLAGEEIERLGLYPEQTNEVNNHIHTSYSFSPYSPSKAAFMARAAGLKAAGSVDHDSIGAAGEMVEACKAFRLGSTVGFEVRVNFNGTFLEQRKINNPDSAGSGYIVIHGVPHNRIDEVAVWLKPVNEERNLRNQKQVERLNSVLPQGILEPLDFQQDIYPLSQAADGGSITERHILFALSNRIIESLGKGPGTVDYVTGKLGIEISSTVKDFLLDEANPHYAYDLLGILKGNLVSRFFIQSNEAECPSASEVVAFANSIGAIPAYSYLGDVAESPTGDKKAEHFEDEYLDDLMPLIRNIGFKAVTYMPPRNTMAQLLRIQKLCARHGFMQISGVDINSSRQIFRCPEIMKPEFSHLIGATWALIAHEHLASIEPELALFSGKGKFAGLSLDEKLEIYSDAGSHMDLRHPEKVIDYIRRIR
ncbi:MAG: PHP domain-containing protein [Spirochaetales bacterium]|nr:PHP domain-containing protein [Spirochaetales bacterium]